MEAFRLPFKTKIIKISIGINNKYKKNKYCIWYLKKIIVLKKLNRQKRRFVGFIGAGEGIRTLDFNLGKVALYP